LKNTDSLLVLLFFLCSQNNTGALLVQYEGSA
jgi:hypothetical protein